MVLLRAELPFLASVLAQTEFAMGICFALSVLHVKSTASSRLPPLRFYRASPLLTGDLTTPSRLLTRCQACERHARPIKGPSCKARHARPIIGPSRQAHDRPTIGPSCQARHARPVIGQSCEAHHARPIIGPSCKAHHRPVMPGPL